MTLSAPIANATSSLMEVSQTAQSDSFATAVALYEEGIALEKEGTPASLLAAIEKYKAAIAIFKSAGIANQQTAAVLHTLGHAYTNAEDLGNAAETFQASLALWQSLGNSEQSLVLQEDVTFSTLGRGMALEREGSPEAINAAIAHYDTALELVGGDENREHRAWLWQQKGHAYQKLTNPELAADAFQTSLQLWQAVDSPNDEQRLRELAIATFYNWGISLQKENSPASIQKALELYQQALPIFEGQELMILKGRLLHVMGHAYEDLSDMESALAAYEQSLAIWQAIGDSEQVTSLQNDIERM